MPITNWKTSLLGIVFAVALNAESLGIPSQYAKPIAGIAAIAWAAMQKDKDVTGVGQNAQRVKELKIND